jgi:serine-type D-Ala-D-Ala endopeptidase (penicillin-binding protein 7)
MLLKLLSHILITGVVLQMIPADAGEVERLATLPESESQAFDLLQAYSFANHLPIAPDTAQAPSKIDPNSIGVVTSAQSAIVVDKESGEVLFEKNISEPRAIGSITKLMTAFVFLSSNPDLDAPASVLSEDYRAGGRLYFSLGDQVTVRDVLKASLVGSDNSATASLVRLSGLTQGDFVARMNETAAQMGMQQTTFADETGLSSKNRSVVHDIAVMLSNMLDQPTISEITQMPSAVITSASGRQYLVESTDELLNTFVNEDPYKIEVAKTGYLPEAGYCLGSAFSFENDQEILVVVLGAGTKMGRFQDVKSLAVWVYDTFQW